MDGRVVLADPIIADTAAGEYFAERVDVYALASDDNAGELRTHGWRLYHYVHGLLSPMTRAAWALATDPPITRTTTDGQSISERAGTALVGVTEYESLELDDLTANLELVELETVGGPVDADSEPQE